ncbi:radical SAM family heme chaperone HemW [Pontibacterium granulatum]|uniref:radical SAM family heme chaperone HemW n=1 Tax=Pontibacterium granulatum TaxID=2036029 RepID=UPI00249C9BE8|nr:radical SAM family heme chaperone HemW [Pontibacterium granulatum]MDI3324642.1 radical SAM family heme chaperone HemW [Pontibacterium granulatum]
MTPIAQPPLSLYIHIPWCVRKCPYCDFNSHAVREEIPEEAYVAALLADLEQELSGIEARPLQSIFIGGGTPSLFSAAMIKHLLAEVESRISFTPDIEITMEANPGTFEQEKFRGYRDAGVNRLSLGIQSFADEQLNALGRIHSGDEAVKAAGLARELFDNMNLDLMHGLPGQSTAQALADLRIAADLKPDHISWYQLTIEPNTEFHSRPPSLPVDETLWDIQEQGQQFLAEAGYRQYEISAYAQPGKRARHNLNYWQFGDYIGIGAGAHGKITGADGTILRRWKQKQPKAYMNPEKRLGACEAIEVDALPFEFMLNALRLTDGVENRLFADRTGLNLDVIQPQLERAQKMGLLETDPKKLAPTQQGRLFLNNLLEMFLEE